MDRRITISLPPDYRAALQELADRRHSGNLSAMVRELIEFHPVTKSELESSPQTTRKEVEHTG